MCFSKKRLCTDCALFPLIDFKSHVFSVEVFTPRCQYIFSGRVKCGFPRYRKLYKSIVDYYNKSVK